MSLFNLFKSTHQSRFTEVIQPHLKRLYHQAYRLTHNQDDAEDLVQELLMRLYEKEVDLTAIEKPASWLLRSLYNQFVNNYRKKSRLPIDNRETDSEEIIDSLNLEKESPQQLYERNFNYQQLQKSICKLNPDQQALISLHDIEGHSLPDLAEIMDLPLGTLKSRLHRARNTLREYILSNEDEEMEPFSSNQRLDE